MAQQSLHRTPASGLPRFYTQSPFQTFANRMKFITVSDLATTIHEVGVHRWMKIVNTWLIVETVDKVMDVALPIRRQRQRTGDIGLP